MTCKTFPLPVSEHVVFHFPDLLAPPGPEAMDYLSALTCNRHKPSAGVSRHRPNTLHIWTCFPCLLTKAKRPIHATCTSQHSWFTRHNRCDAHSTGFLGTCTRWQSPQSMQVVSCLLSWLFIFVSAGELTMSDPMKPPTILSPDVAVNSNTSSASLKIHHCRAKTDPFG